MTKLEELKAAHTAAYDALDAAETAYAAEAADDAWAAYAAAESAYYDARAAYQAELKKTKESKNGIYATNRRA